ncbi:MAG: PPC domain-containing protein [Planctomycetes bacterium]|nr:PPC domain-containing protein [Planctomycetota bacterium]MCB9904658.1 PPC domain-containing protein [Planctomycetota bacterium]
MRFSTFSKPFAGALAALLVSGVATAQVCPGDDVYEPNDDCASATPLAVGALSNLAMIAGTNASNVPDFYSYTMANGEAIVIDVLFLHANGDIDLRLYSDAACTVQIDTAGSVSDNEQVDYTNNTGGPLTVTLKVFPWNVPVCNDYSINLTSTPPPVNCPGADAFEPNDTCAAPSVLPVGLTPLLNINSMSDPDFWSYTIQNNESLTVDVLFSHAGGDIDARLWGDNTCSTLLTSSSTTTDDEQLVYVNTSGAAITAVLEVYPSNVSACNEYNLQVTSLITPCLSTPDDAYEPNDDCSQAIALAPGTYNGLEVFKNVSDDFFTISVPDGGNLTVDVLFLTVNGDIDCYLYDPSTLGTTCGDKANYLDNGFTGSDNEQMTWTNSTGSTQTYYIQVNLWDNAGNEDCNNYDLVLTVDTPTVGTVMCVGDGTDGACPCGNESALGAGEGCKNSLGFGSILSASGSTSVAADDIAFTVTQARANQPGMLVQGSTLIATPFKDGLLCMGNPTERVEVVFMDANGEGTTVTSIVTNGAVSAGMTRWYQMWSRDPGGVSPCGTGSNFSNGLEVIYTL